MHSLVRISHKLGKEKAKFSLRLLQLFFTNFCTVLDKIVYRVGVAE